MPKSLLAAALAALLLGGCTTPPAGAPAGNPAAVFQSRPALPPASIRGSQETSALLDSFTVFLVAVDGRNLAAGRKGWDQPVMLAAGLHRLAVEFNRGAFVARAELPLMAKPGTGYELRQANDAQVYGGHSYCEFWIVDLATGEKVTAVQRTPLEKRATGG